VYIASVWDGQDKTLFLAQLWELQSDFAVDCDLTNFSANGECGPLNAGGFGVSNPAFTWDDRAREGWGVREYSNQWSMAIQHELRPGLGVSVGYYHTAFHNQQVRVDTSLSASDSTSHSAPGRPDQPGAECEVLSDADSEVSTRTCWLWNAVW
jgi:hypothetical protein